MKRYAQIKAHPEITPDVGPSPRPVYPYMEPAKAERFANWLRQPTTKSSITVPNA